MPSCDHEWRKAYTEHKNGVVVATVNICSNCKTFQRVEGGEPEPPKQNYPKNYGI